MADLFENRCVSEQFSRSAHLLRVACIGDSMVWGQGVAARLTLPAHLNHFLNAAVPDDLVWVDNFGESSGNLWHAWSRMRARAAVHAFDAIVFSVCQNDTQLFESNLVQYGDDKRPYWDPGAPHFAHAKRLFEDFASVCKDRSIVPLVIFYVYVHADRTIAEALAKLMRSLEIPFIDMLSYYEDETSIDTAAYIASEFDGHPSSLAHELAARRVAIELCGHIATRGSRSFTANPSDGVHRAVSDLIEQQVPVDAALDWARGALDEKYCAVRRRRRLEDRAVLETVAQLSRDVECCERDWRAARRVEGCLRAFAGPAGCRAAALPQLFASLRNLEEAVLLIDGVSDVRELATLSETFVKGGYLDRTHQLEFFDGELGREIAQARSCVEGTKVVQLARRQTADEGLLRASTRLRESLDPASGACELSFVREAIDRLAAQLSALDRLGATWRHTMDRANVRPVWAMVCHLLRSTTYYLYSYDQALFGNLTLEAENGRPWTCVDVTLENRQGFATEGTCRLVGQADYIVPERMCVRDVLWAGLSKNRAVYHFELPLMIFGDLRAGVTENDPARGRFLDGSMQFTSVRIYNYPPDEFLTGVSPRDDARLGDTALANEVVFRRMIEWSVEDSRLPMIEFPRILIP